MEHPEFFVGIDFGHGETSVSRVPGTNGEKVSRVPLGISGKLSDQKVFSAIWRSNNGEWQFIWSEDDLIRPNVMEGFKGMIKDLPEDKREALREFAKLVFKTILKNDPKLKYDPETKKANFVICIANPSDWRRQDPSNPKEYLSFFQEEAGIKPAKMCINESDAAFYTKFEDYSPSDKVFVIDLGSSTIDFTTYHDSICIHNCCWGHNLGAHLVEDKLVEYGYSKAEERVENKENMRLVTKERERLHLGQAESALSLAARFAKESYFTRVRNNEDAKYKLDVKVRELVPNWPNKTQIAFSVIIDSSTVESVIKDYISNLARALSNAVKKLQDYGISPNKVLLSGGASRMPFIWDLTVQAFPDAEVIRDNCPEWVVSDGAARYAEVHYQALEDRNKLQDEFSSWAETKLDDKLRETAVSTFNSILKEKMKSGLNEKYVNSSSGSLNSLESTAKNILEGITRTDEFKTMADSNFVAVVDAHIKSELEGIIYSNYGRKVTIHESFINPGDTFANVAVGTGFLHDCIAAIADVVCNNSIFESVGSLDWSKTRSPNKRQKIVNLFLSRIDYDSFNHDIDIDEFISQAVGKIDKILDENGLFPITTVH